MKINIHQSLNHLVSILNGQEKQKRLLKLEEQIEQTEVEANLNKLNESVYNQKMHRLHFLQYNYLMQKGKYYQYGIYKKEERK